MSDMQNHSPGLAAASAYRLVVVLCVVCAGCYALALQGPFFFDDIPNLIDNPLLRIDGWTLDDWRAAIISNNAGLLHRPVAMASFAINYLLAGAFVPWLFKGTNLVIHLLTGVLLYHLFLALLRTPALTGKRAVDPRGVALLAAALWLLHPLHVSTVLYVVQRMAQLSALFSVAGLLLYCRYRLRWIEAGAAAGEILAAGLWLALLALAAILSKENGALLLWLIPVVEASLFKGVWKGEQRAALRRLAWALLLLPLLLLGLVLVWSPEWVTGRYSGRSFTIEDRVLTQLRILWHYLDWILLPNITSMGFFHDDIPLSRSLISPATTALSLAGWVALVTGAFLLRRSQPLLLFALLFFLVAHAMESTVLPLEMVFEHRNYLPSAGICLWLAALIFELSRRLVWLRLPLVLGAVVGVLTLQLFLRTAVWSDELTFARANVMNHPESPRANFYYGNVLYARFGKAEALGLNEDEQLLLAVNARIHFDRMHKLAPDAFPALVMLYQLDTLHFPKLALDNDWLKAIEDLSSVKRLHASDRDALAALVAFSASPMAEADRSRIGGIIDEVVARYPRRPDLVRLKYLLMAREPNISRDALRLYLQKAVLQGNRGLYPILLQNHGAEDMDLTYSLIGGWMQRDSRRRELPIVRRLFEP